MVGFQRARVALFLREYKSTPTCFWMDSGMSFSDGGGGGGGGAMAVAVAERNSQLNHLLFLSLYLSWLAAFSIIALLSLSPRELHSIIA